MTTTMVTILITWITIMITTIILLMTTTPTMMAIKNDVKTVVHDNNDSNDKNKQSITARNLLRLLLFRISYLTTEM